MTGQNSRSSLVNFFIYNTDYGQREGYEDEKIMLYVPQDENEDVKNKCIGLCQALVQFTLTFNPTKPCQCLNTLKAKQYFSNPEGNFWIVLTLSVPHSEKIVKDKKVLEYYPDDLQDPISEAILRQSYEMFVLFNGLFTFILNKYGRPVLQERLEFFYTRYLQTLNFGQLDLLDIYQGISYLPLDKTEFLRVQCFSNLIENTFSSVDHVCILQNDLLLWTSLSQKDMKILYKYLTSSLFPATTVDNEDSNSKGSNSPSSRNSSPQINATFPNPGKFLTAPLEMVKPGFTIPKRAPRIFVHVENEIKELNLLVYKAFSCIICLLIDIQMLNTEFCSKLHNFIGPQLGSLSSIITEQALKRNVQSIDQQYRFIYYNSMNLAIKSSIHAKRSSLVSVASEIMKLLVDIHQDFGESDEKGSETIMKTSADCWIVGRRAGCREFFVILNQKNASLVDIDEELRQVINTSFSNILFLN